MENSERRLTTWLRSAPLPVLTLFAVTWAFSAYFCMYAFRKPFSAAAEYDGLMFMGSQRDAQDGLRDQSDSGLRAFQVNRDTLLFRNSTDAAHLGTHRSRGHLPNSRCCCLPCCRRT